MATESEPRQAMILITTSTQATATERAVMRRVTAALSSRLMGTAVMTQG